MTAMFHARQAKPVVTPAIPTKSKGIVLSEGKAVRIPHPRPIYQEKKTINHDFVAAPKNDAPVIGPSYRPSVRMTRADLINAESKLGSMIFGPIPAGHRREFFHDQKNVWIWHEDWYDGHHNAHQMTIRYEVRTSGVYKKVSTGKYFKLEGEELENFRKATHAYLHVIKKNLYNRTPHLIKMPTTA